jgi:hypothetical protein
MVEPRGVEPLTFSLRTRGSDPERRRCARWFQKIPSAKELARSSPATSCASQPIQLFRFTLFWKKTILIIKEVGDRRIKFIKEWTAEWMVGEATAGGYERGGGAKGIFHEGADSEQEGLFTAIGLEAQTHSGRTLGTFDG